MSIAQKIGDFTIERLGVEYPDFPGYGLGPGSKYDYCAYGIGDTEEEALADCLEQAAEQGFDIDDSDEKRIRADLGDVDDQTTVAEYLGIDEDAEDADCDAYYHIGMKWNSRDTR
jgi:hypothetical protein